MHALLKKMNYKGNAVIVMLNVPAYLHPLQQDFAKEATIVESTKDLDQVDFVIAFVTSGDQIETTMEQIIAKLREDGVLWYCYPKKSSKRYACAIDRDHGWEVLGEHGFEPVRQVALDEEFSALRFRRVTHIKRLTRSANMALSTQAKNRIEE